MLTESEAREAVGCLLIIQFSITTAVEPPRREKKGKETCAAEVNVRQKPPEDKVAPSKM